MEKGKLEKLQLKPQVIEEALEHCSTQEQCAGCPLLHISREQYCGHLLTEESLKYIRILKDLNRTLAQRIEALEGGEVQ